MASGSTSEPLSDTKGSSLSSSMVFAITFKHCKPAELYHENAIGVYKQLEVEQKPEFILVGHLPMELSFLMHSFLKSRDDNILIAEVTGARKRENGLVVPCVYHGRSTSFQVAKILKKQLIKASALFIHMKIEVSGTAIIKKSLF